MEKSRYQIFFWSWHFDKIVLQTNFFFNYPSTNTNPCLLDGSKRMLFLSQKMGDLTSIHHNQRLFANTVTVTKAQFNSYHSKAHHNFKEILILPKSSGVDKDSHLRDHYVLFVSNWWWLIDTWRIKWYDFDRAKRFWPVIFGGGQIDHNVFNLLLIMTNYAGHH